MWLDGNFTKHSGKYNNTKILGFLKNYLEKLGNSVKIEYCVKNYLNSEIFHIQSIFQGVSKSTSILENCQNYQNFEMAE